MFFDLCFFLPFFGVRNSSSSSLVIAVPSSWRRENQSLSEIRRALLESTTSRVAGRISFDDGAVVVVGDIVGVCNGSAMFGGAMSLVPLSSSNYLTQLQFWGENNNEGGKSIFDVAEEILREILRGT